MHPPEASNLITCRPALAPQGFGGNIDRVMPLMRPFISAVVAACFALSTITWGTMPGCTTPAPAPSAHSGSGHPASHDHPASAGHAPGTPQCPVHLCCVQLATLSSKAPFSARLSEPAGAAGFLGKTRVVHARPSHTLPFAHAPPHSIA
jgi:hypothetical protein